MRRGLSWRVYAFTATIVGAGALTWVLSAGAIASADVRALVAGAAALLAALIGRPLLAQPAAIVRAVSDGLLAYHDKDYSVRVARVDSDPWDLARRFNRLGEQLRSVHVESYEKELLLETVQRATPTAIVLENEAGRVVYSNATARELLGAGARLEGRMFGDLLGELAPEVREALAAPDDTLVSVDEEGGPQIYDIARRFFHLNTQRHRLTMIRPMGRELERREAEAWKKAMRVISHELHNSLAPISSLVHSARALIDQPGSADKLRLVFATVEERTRHLKDFLDGFARVARLPTPRPEPTPWSPFVEGVRALHSFSIEGTLPEAPGWFDRTQLQQVLINLFKNAIEAGSPGEGLALAVVPGANGVLLRVMDRGKGMSEEVRRNALLPFYSTKKSGAGVGLSLCREIVDAHGGRLTLMARAGGGTIVECWLPGPPPPNVVSIASAAGGGGGGGVVSLSGEAT